MKVYPFFLPHAGCRHRCSFCDQSQVTGRIAVPTPEEVGRTLDSWLPDKGAGEVAFYGGSFTQMERPLQAEYLTRVQSYIRQGRAGGIRISTRPDALAPAQVNLLRRFGVSTVEIGCQSFSSSILRRSRRGHSVADSIRAVETLRAAGLKVGIQLMPGLPGGTRREARLSLLRALSLAPDFLRIYPAVVLRGSELESLVADGAFRPLSLSRAVDWCAELLYRCQLARMPVVRIGLQGGDGLQGDDAVVSGPFHPAFGQLVRSRLWFLALDKILDGTGGEVVQVSRDDLSDALGHGRQNLAALQRRHGRLSIAAAGHIDRSAIHVAGKNYHLPEILKLQDFTRRRFHD